MEMVMMVVDHEGNATVGQIVLIVADIVEGASADIQYLNNQ
jgi:hypothetical protein